MKTMTCRQPGRLYHHPDRGEMADDVINAPRTRIYARPWLTATPRTNRRLPT